MDPVDPANFSFVQIFIMIFGMMIIYEQYKLYKLDPNNWRRALNACAWACHVMAFYIFLLIDSQGWYNFHSLNPKFFTEWSPYLRLHSAVAFYLIIQSNLKFTAFTIKTKEILTKYYSKVGIINDD